MARVTDAHERGRLSEDDRYTVRRYEEFRAAAAYVCGAFAAVPAVIRVALFGSVASPPRIEATRRWPSQIHVPKDVDLAVWLDGPADLNQLRVLCGRAVHQLWQEKEMGVAHHQVDVFLLDATGKYLGRLCHFNQCPQHRPQCQAERCGHVPFLQQHEGFLFDGAASLGADRIQILYDRR